MDYFRAVCVSGEKTQRVLDLTASIISQNAAHYTVWKLRADCLEALNADYDREMEWLNKLSVYQPKSYQIWHHRLVVIERLGNPANERPFLNQMLADDSKNYHLWTYRQWVLAKFGRTREFWDDELLDVNTFLDKDVRNNSAWTHRYFYFGNRPQGFGDIDFEKEMEYVIIKIKLAPHNESPWSYARGIIKYHNQSLDQVQSLVSLAQDYVKSHISQALLYMLDVYELQLKKGENDAKASAQKVLELLTQHDPIRKEYWKYRQLDFSK
ncbi:hypothetical protein SeLEV6574_g04486 [Synchytrium endobioticum]|nr:hypothetical protein SeLEV6574_g04486 [Synchytrium endobioticum]